MAAAAGLARRRRPSAAPVGLTEMAGRTDSSRPARKLGLAPALQPSFSTSFSGEIPDFLKTSPMDVGIDPLGPTEFAASTSQLPPYLRQPDPDVRNAGVQPPSAKMSSLPLAKEVDDKSLYKSDFGKSGQSGKSDEAKDGAAKKSEEAAKPGLQGKASSKATGAGQKAAKEKAGARPSPKSKRVQVETEAGEAVVEVIALPPIDTDPPHIDRAQIPSFAGAQSFKPSAEPRFRVEPRAGGKPEPPKPERDRALALFRQAIAQTARLHASFLAAAQQATDSVQETESSLASLAQGDLDRGLTTLRLGLDQARLDLDQSADAADSFIEQRRLQDYVAITKAANSAFGALNALKSSADKTFKGHEGERTAKGKEADTAQGGVTGAGDAAAASVRNLDESKEHDHPTNIESMASAINEAIDLRLPKRSKERAQTYTDERNAQDAQLSKVFLDLKGALEKQFAAIGKAMNETAKNSASSISRSRDAARTQLAKGAAQMHDSVAQARARGHAALIGQHNMLRRQMIASHRDRALRENTLAQQRAARGTGAALDAAKTQQTGATGLGEALAKEASRPPDDFAKVMSSSSSGMLRQVEKTGPQQRGRLERGVRSGEDDARAQSRTLGHRLDGSADDAAGQLEAAAKSSGDLLAEQVRTGTAPFDEIPGQVRSAFGSTYPTSKKAYEAQNEGTKKEPGAGQLIVAAGETIKATIDGDGGGKPPVPPPAPEGKDKGPKEKPAAFKVRAKGISEKPNSDDGIAALLEAAKSDIPPRIENKVGPLYNALMAFSTNVESVMVELRGLTKQQGRALSDLYRDNEGGRDLAWDLQTELWKTFSSDYTNEHNINAALSYLAGNTAEAAKYELQSAVYLWNDTGRSEKVLRALTPEQLDELKKEHPDVIADVSGDLDESEKKIFDALKEIKPVENLEGKALEDRQKENYRLLGVANSYALKRDIDQAMETKGEAGGDKAADTVAGAYQSAGSDTLSSGDGAYEIPGAAEERRKAIWKETESSFEKAAPTLPDGSPNEQAAEGPKLGAIARYAAAARTYTEFVPDDGPNGGHYETVKKGLDPRQAQLIDDISKTGPNSVETAASTIEFETNRKEGKPREDRLRKALLGDDLMGAKEGESDEDRAKRLADSKNEKGEIEKGDLAKTKERKANILKLVAERRAAGQKTSDGEPVEQQSPEQVQKQITDQLDERFAGDKAGAAYTKSMIESETLEPDPGKAFDFALAHDERNKETLKATTERMNRDQIKAAVEKWDSGKPEGDRLYARLGLYGHKGKLEGDARNEVEIAFRGKPRNDKEKALIAIMVVEQQRRDSAATGRALAHGEYDRMVGEQSKVLGYLGVKREDIDEEGDIKATGPDGKPIKGKWDEKTGKLNLGDEQRADFESAMRFSHMDAESYKQAVDRISQGIVMALIVAAAIITTFVTFGGAAAIWGPILITAAAGFAGMGMTALIRGDRYTSAEMQRDFVMTLVQAATAGLGAGLGAAGKAAGTAAKGAAALEKGAAAAAEAAATGEKLAAGAAELAGKETMTFGGKALQFGKEVVIGGGTNAINSFAAGAMDPENRRQGKSLDKGVEGGLRGFLSGSVGAALSKPASALGRPFGKAAERMAGNVTGGFGTRLADARIGQAMGDPHQSWAESIENAKEGIAQDAIQAFGEHVSEGAAEHRAEARARARAAGRAEEPHKAPIAPAPRDEHAGAAQPTVPRPPPHLPTEGIARATAVQEAIPPELRPLTEKAGVPSPADLDAAARQTHVEPTRPLEELVVRAPGIADETKGTRLTRPEAPVEETAIISRSRAGADEPIEMRSNIRPPGDETEPAQFRSNRSDDTDARLRDRRSATGFEDEPTNPNIKLPTLEEQLQAIKERKTAPGEERKDTGIVIATADLTVAKLDQLDAQGHRIPGGSEITAHDSKSRDAALSNYHALREFSATQGREVLLAYNTRTKDYVVIQGEIGQVTPRGGDYITLRHSHPEAVTMITTAEKVLHGLPSGRPGDIAALMSEAWRQAAQHGGVSTVTSTIDVHYGTRVLETEFSVTHDQGKASIRVEFTHPETGTKYEMGPYFSIDQYAEGVLKLFDVKITVGDASLPAMMSAREDSIIHRGDPVSVEDRGAARSVAENVAQAAGLEEPVRAGRMSEIHEMVRTMGLVDQPDSLARLTNLLNVDDPKFTPAMRAAVASATLEATRADLIRTGQLAPGDDVLMLFRGVTAERMGGYEREGINLARLGPGRDEDAGRGLYGSQDLESAMRYTGQEGGTVLPLIVRKSELGNVIDVRSGTPLGDRWLAFVRTSKGKGRIWPEHAHLRGQLFPGLDVPLALERDLRGARFEDFLKSVASDPTLPEAVRTASRDPHMTLMDLGGVASTGNDRGILTDQWAMHSQHIADMFNEAHGFPVPGREGPGSVPASVGETGEVMRSNVQDRKAKPPAPGSAGDPAEIAAMARTGPAVDEINAAQRALGQPSALGARAAIAKIRSGGPEASAAQAHLDRLYDTPKGAIVVNISDERIKELSRGLKPGESRSEMVGGMELRLYRAQATKQNENPPVRYDAVVPEQQQGKPLRIYQFGDGELRVWRTASMAGGPGQIIQSSLVGPGKARAGLEEAMFSQGESYERTAATPIGPQAGGYHGPALERGHLHGAGLGVESPFGIGLVPREVNQELQARGIEAWMRRLRDALPPGAELIYSTDVSFHESSNRHSRIGYKLDLVIQGRQVPFAEFAIHIEADRPWTPAPQRRGTTGIYVSPLEFHVSNYPHVQTYLEALREIVNIPEVLHSGLPRARPEREQVEHDLHQLEPQTIVSIARAAEPWQLETHNPPPAPAFRVSKWENELGRILDRGVKPRNIVVDLRGLGLKPFQKEQIGRALDRLPERDQRRILLLDDKVTKSSRKPVAFHFLQLVAEGEESDS